MTGFAVFLKQGYAPLFETNRRVRIGIIGSIKGLPYLEVTLIK